MDEGSGYVTENDTSGHKRVFLASEVGCNRDIVPRQGVSPLKRRETPRGGVVGVPTHVTRSWVPVRGDRVGRLVWSCVMVTFTNYQFNKFI